MPSKSSSSLPPTKPKAIAKAKLIPLTANKNCVAKSICSTLFVLLFKFWSMLELSGLFFGSFVCHVKNMVISQLTIRDSV